jgi:hypothetical protein
MICVCERKPRSSSEVTRRGKASDAIVADRGSGLTICALKEPENAIVRKDSNRTIVREKNKKAKAKRKPKRQERK